MQKKKLTIEKFKSIISTDSPFTDATGIIDSNNSEIFGFKYITVWKDLIVMSNGEGKYGYIAYPFEALTRDEYGSESKLKISNASEMISYLRPLQAVADDLGWGINYNNIDKDYSEN